LNKKLIKISDRLLTIIIFALYPAALVFTFLSEFGVIENSLTLKASLIVHGAVLAEDVFIPMILIPLTGFIFCSILRRCINRKRPFAVTGEEPLIEKKNEGRSFPSRHAFSAFVIGLTILFLSISLNMTVGVIVGIVILILGAMICHLRVLAKIHYPSDVIFGACFGAVWAVVGLIVYYCFI